MYLESSKLVEYWCFDINSPKFGSAVDFAQNMVVSRLHIS